MSDADDLMKKFQQLINLMQSGSADMVQDIDSLLDHIAYKPPALKVGDVITFQGTIYRHKQGIFVRYLLPSEHAPFNEGKLITNEDDDILVLVGIIAGHTGVYAPCNSRLIEKVNGNAI